MPNLSLLSVFLLFLAPVVLSDDGLVPTAPGPGEYFNSGSDCVIQWNRDTTGTWRNVTIDLMSGSNTHMTLVTNVVSGLDGTDPQHTSLQWICPEVNPNSEIYFYQFTNGLDVMNSKWTTRFTIRSASGKSVPPENMKQSNGDPIPWGNGTLVLASEEDAPQNPDSDDCDENDLTTDSGYSDDEDPDSESSDDTNDSGEGDEGDDADEDDSSDETSAYSNQGSEQSSGGDAIMVGSPPMSLVIRKVSQSLPVTSEAGIPPTNHLGIGQVTSSSAKIHVGLNIVPSILVSLFILI